jgi:hypothetical protein
VALSKVGPSLTQRMIVAMWRVKMAKGNLSRREIGQTRAHQQAANFREGQPGALNQKKYFGTAGCSEAERLRETDALLRTIPFLNQNRESTLSTKNKRLRYQKTDKRNLLKLRK